MNADTLRAVIDVLPPEVADTLLPLETLQRRYANLIERMVANRAALIECGRTGNGAGFTAAAQADIDLFGELVELEAERAVQVSILVKGALAMMQLAILEKANG